MEPEIAQVQSLLAGAQNILILTGKNPRLDGMAAALALYLGLEKVGKNVSVACPDQPTVEFGRLVGIDKVAPTLGNKNLVISFPYTEGSVEKVSYDIEDGKFNLVIQPRAGVKSLSPGDVQYSFQGGNAGLIFTVDTSQLENLASFYTQEPDLYSSTPVVNIDSHPENTRYGRVNLVDSQSSSTSEIVALLLKRLEISFDEDLATNLFTGITWATNNFSSPQVGPSTFEAAAFCLRAGARRPKIEEKKENLKMPVSPTFSLKPKSSPQIPETPQPPHEWLKPKIYKGSTLV